MDYEIKKPDDLEVGDHFKLTASARLTYVVEGLEGPRIVVKHLVDGIETAARGITKPFITKSATNGRVLVLRK